MRKWPKYGFTVIAYVLCIGKLKCLGYLVVGSTWHMPKGFG